MPTDRSQELAKIFSSNVNYYIRGKISIALMWLEAWKFPILLLSNNQSVLCSNPVDLPRIKPLLNGMILPPSRDFYLHFRLILACLNRQKWLNLIIYEGTQKGHKGH